MPDFISPAVIWIVIAIASAIIEVAATHFGLIFVAGGAIVAAVVAYYHGGIAVQLALFSITVVVSFTVLRPRMVSKFHAPGVPSRTDPLIGQEGLVTHDIDPALGAGRVTVRGQDWAAHSPVAIAAGERVRIASVDGIVLDVRREQPS